MVVVQPATTALLTNTVALDFIFTESELFALSKQSCKSFSNRSWSKLSYMCRGVGPVRSKDHGAYQYIVELRSNKQPKKWSSRVPQNSRHLLLIRTLLHQ